MPIEFIELNDGTKFPVSPAYKSVADGEPITYVNQQAASSGGVLTPGFSIVSTVGGSDTTLYTFYKISDAVLTKAQLAALTAKATWDYSGTDILLSGITTGACTANENLAMALASYSPTTSPTNFKGFTSVLDLIPTPAPVVLISIGSDDIGSSYSQEFSVTIGGTSGIPMTITQDLTSASAGLYVANALQPESGSYPGLQAAFESVLLNSTFDLTIADFNFESEYIGGMKSQLVVFGAMFPLTTVMSSGFTVTNYDLFSNIAKKLYFAGLNGTPLIVYRSTVNGEASTGVTNNVNKSSLTTCTWAFSDSSYTYTLNYNLVTGSLTGSVSQS